MNEESSGESSDSFDPQNEKNEINNKMKMEEQIGDHQDAESDPDNERTKIREELSSLSFEELIKLKEKLGSKVYNEALFGQSESEMKKKTSRSSVSKDFKRANKNRPREMSAKRPVPLLGNELKTDKVIRDPRFDTKCGEYNSKIFKENYSFISEIREKEVDTLKNQLKNEINEDERNRIKFVIQRLENQNREERKRKLKEEVLKEEKEEIKKAKQENKKPHYLTKKERRTKELIKQFEDLKRTGKLKKHLEKRRKKNVSKDRKKFSFD